ncbi:hypothetical protein [Massilia pseudoviolaceinigra]|uniref:hypothetical protein n=1 Tax=Massilia pseudoviolaceinigra TaxID=3057165 RepID=UPI0027964A31|nr:hypothetical protein [Massilia sp. CCM 9206]MDQ1922068.1 hypothetical protein [Massilia sp. CCM 9206]
MTTAPLAAARWPAFDCYAASIGAKPMVIELARGVHPVQPMLTLCRDGALEEVVRFAQALAGQAAQSGFEVVRCKIEQDASADVIRTPGARHHYVEWHGRMVVPEPIRMQLAALSEQYGAHLSNNAIRGGDIRYVTLRETGGHAALRRRVAALSDAIAAQGWVIGKQQWESVVFDSNLTLDSGWLEHADDD